MFIYGSYAFIGWNLIPVAVYNIRRNTYQREFEEGRHSKSWDKLDGTEAYFAFFGWDMSVQRKRKIDLKNWTIEEIELEEGVEPVKLLHDLPPAEVARRDFEAREKKLEDLRKSLSKRKSQIHKMPFNSVIFPSNAIFEF